MLLIITVITAAGKTWFVVMFSLVRISLVLIKELYLNQGNQCCWYISFGTSGYEELCDYAANSHGPLFGTALEISIGL